MATRAFSRHVCFGDATLRHQLLVIGVDHPFWSRRDSQWCVQSEVDASFASLADFDWSCGRALSIPTKGLNRIFSGKKIGSGKTPLPLADHQEAKAPVFASQFD